MSRPHGRVVRALRRERGDAAPTVADLDRDYYVAMAAQSRAYAAAERAGALAHLADSRRCEARGDAERAGTYRGCASAAGERATHYDASAAEYDRMAAASLSGERA